jgi:Arc/MetJ-type ribon-helix-helix transcriptional regulator
MKISLRGLCLPNKQGEIKKVSSIEIDKNKIKSFKDLSIHLRDYYYKNDKFELLFSSNGRNILLHEKISNFPGLFKLFEVRTILRGGKGGFGSLLKGQPPVKKRTNNFDSCRDLSGRRIRHVNQEKLLREWQQKKMEEERLLNALNNPNEENNLKNYIESDNKKAVNKLNKKYIEESTETTNSISDSIRYLMRKKKREEEKDREDLGVNINFNNKCDEVSSNNFPKNIPKNNFYAIEKQTKNKYELSKSILDNLEVENINLDLDLLEKELFSLDY